jgi:hypothetical protein
MFRSAVAFVSALLLVPAIAIAAKGPPPPADLSGPAGYCQDYDAAAGRAVGTARITTSPTGSPGFHPVWVDLRIRGGKLPAGSYQVWLVDVYRDDSGSVVGCAASPFTDPLVVSNRGPTDFHGSVDRYSGEHELQVYVGPILGPGYGTAPALVDVP